MVVSASSEVAVEAKLAETPFDIETIFLAQFGRVVRVIKRVVQDQGRAEDLAVEVFCKLWRTPKAQGNSAEGWLYRVAVRKGLDELRRRTRRNQYESRLGVAEVPNPEDLCSASEEQERVRSVLAAIDSRDAELLLLRADGLSYEELASALELNGTSVGTFLSRARDAFRTEYIKRYGQG